MTRKILLTTVCLLAALPVAALAQSRATAAFDEEVEVTEVVLDALVTDRSGTVVLGLEPDDFVVTEDGEPVELLAADFYSNRRLLESAEATGRLGVDAADGRANRYFILFFHDQSRLLPRLKAQQMEAAKRAKEWVETGLLLDDWVAVVSYRDSLRVHSDFSRDRQALSRAIDDSLTGRNALAEWPSRAAELAEGPSLLAGLPQGRALARATPRIYDGLELLAEAAAPIPGRKNLVLWSIGFGNVNEVGFYRPDRRYYPSMMRALNDANVAVYSVDLIPGGSGALGNSLSQLSDDTNGTYFYLFVNFATPLERIERENNGYYLLSYRARQPAGEAGFQKVEVETKNPDFDVRARGGYRFGEG